MIYEPAELYALLDSLLAKEWAGFYEDRSRPVPFFVDCPDESLAEWVSQGRIHSGTALDIGCGNGRNSRFLASQGFTVTGVDLDSTAIQWAQEQGGDYVCGSVFDLPLGTYDLIFDSGCFHHLPPHRRKEYVQLIARRLRPGGYFGLTCFRPEGGSGLTDREVYERWTLGGGLGYTEEQLRAIWSRELEILELRPMGEVEGLFGKDFLWVMLAQANEPQ